MPWVVRFPLGYGCCMWLIHIICFCLPFLFVFLLPFICILPSLLALLLSLTFQNMDRLRFQAGGRRRRLNLGLVCFVLMFAVFFGWLLNKKAARVEVNISLAFLHWVRITFHPWPFVSDFSLICAAKRDIKLQLTNWVWVLVERSFCGLCVLAPSECQCQSTEGNGLAWFFPLDSWQKACCCLHVSSLMPVWGIINNQA